MFNIKKRFYLLIKNINFKELNTETIIEKGDEHNFWIFKRGPGLPPWTRSSYDSEGWIIIATHGEHKSRCTSHLDQYNVETIIKTFSIIHLINFVQVIGKMFSQIENIFRSSTKNYQQQAVILVLFRVKVLNKIIPKYLRALTLVLNTYHLRMRNMRDLITHQIHACLVKTFSIFYFFQCIRIGGMRVQGSTRNTNMRV